VPELVYPPVIQVVLAGFRALDLKIDVRGAEHVPATGGAVLASTHVSYLDFIFAGLGARPAGRLVRFMAKKEVFDHPVSGPLMRGMRHIPVDRRAGAGAYDAALEALRSGELIGIFPEATISQSFEVKAIKSGAVRLASAAGVPLIPLAIWGTQRLWTKGRPRNFGQRGIPIIVTVGEPMALSPDESAHVTTQRLRERMTQLQRQAQDSYPDKPAPGESPFWLPARMGGSAPTPQQADELDRAERKR
jgi:1-acyl-sn-glycerol-3-phosphate acyltransferase